MRIQSAGNHEDDYRNIVALFSKALTMDMVHPPKLDDVTGTSRSCWTVLGYFDFLQVYPLSQEGNFWLGDVLKHNQTLSEMLDGNYYFHPFHLTAGTSEAADAEIYRRFWTEDETMPFMLLTLVQEAQMGSIRKIREAVMSRMKQETVKCVCYRTMELSDLVVVWRSNSMFDIFQAIHELYLMEEVGDMSSFSMIRQELICSPAGSNGVGLDPGKEFFASARYVVRKAEASHDYLQQMKNAGIDISHVYFSTGMEDLHMLQEHMSMTDFLQLLRAHLGDAHRHAFFECSTRLGIPENITEDALAEKGMREKEQLRECGEGTTGGEAGPAFSEKCRNLLTQFQNVRKETASISGPYEISWMKPASNLLNALADMSKNWVMDGFCYLIYDAAQLFCKKVKIWSESGQSMNVKTETECVQRFIRGWGGLMEQSTRMDGRFIQMPGFSPALCEIPAYLLEFYLAVMMQCANLMADQTDKHDVALLLVPKICRRMKVITILEQTKSRDHLLYVDIPTEMLYDPVSVLCGLCHELAHYVGETWRKRQLRGNMIIYCAAYELACQLKIRTDSVVQEIYSHLRELCVQKNEPAIRYVESLKVLLRMGIKSLISDDEIFLKWHELNRNAQNQSFAETRFTQFESDVYRSQILADTTELFDDLANLIYLFRECYADMTMLCLLDPSEKMYLDFAEQELKALTENEEPENEEAENKEAFRDSSQYYVLVERWGLVIRAAYKKSLWQKDSFQTAADNVAEAAFRQDIDRFIAWFDDSDGESIEGHRSKETLQQVFDYLCECYDTMDTLLNNGELRKTREELRLLFTELSKHYDINYQACEQFTKVYREYILKK